MDGSRRLKSFLDARATARLQQRGHTRAMAATAKREAWWWLQARIEAARKGSRVRRGWGVVWPEAGRAELAPVEVAEAGAGEVTIEVVASAVSPGTERALYLRLPGTAPRFPLRPGYSASGVVVATGRGVTGLEPGDPVAARMVRHASVATVTARLVHKLPAGVRLEDASLIHLGVIARYGLHRAGAVEGRTVCVVGSGLIGALAQRLALADGAEGVVVIAASGAKEPTARKSGARLFLESSRLDEIAELGAQVVIDATGSPEAVSVALAAAAPGARVVLLGSARGVTRDLDLGMLRRKRISLVGAHVSRLLRELGPGGFREAGDAFLAALAAEALDVSDLVERTVDPREPELFYRELASGADIVGARFDWAQLPSSERSGRVGFVRLPDISARGVDARAPIALNGSVPGVGRSELSDPFAGSEGFLRIGLVGCGDIAGANARAADAAPNVELAACFDPKTELAQDIARRHGAVATRSFEELLERDDVDAVFLCVPHHLHAPLAAHAARAGKHVLVEKPPAVDLAGAVAMARATEEAGVGLSVCFPMRYSPSALLARRLVREGMLGPVTGGHATYFADKTAAYWHGGFSGRSVSDWRVSRDMAGGGVLIMNLSHFVDLLLFVTGLEATSVLASAAADPGADVERDISVAVRFANGALATLVGCAARPGSRPGSSEFGVWGRDGQLRFERGLRLYTLHALDGVRTSRWHSFADLPRRDERAVFLSRFATTLHRGERPDVTAHDAIAVQAVIEAAYRSAESGRTVGTTEVLEAAPT